MDEPQTDGIYSVCPICWAVAADTEKHEAWHVSRGEAVTNG